MQVSEQMQGFLLTRHWRDTAAGTEVDFWLATDEGPRHVRLAPQPSVGFIPAEQREQAEALLRGERSVELRTLALSDFHRRPVLGLYCNRYQQLLKLQKRLRQNGVDVYEADVRPPERYLMERFITAPVRFDGRPGPAVLPVGRKPGVDHEQGLREAEGRQHLEIRLGPDQHRPDHHGQHDFE